MNDCHMCSGLKNVCSTACAPGASRKIATSAPSTTRVLAVEMTVPPRPPPSSRAPRPVRANEPGGGLPADPGGGPPAEHAGGLPLSATGGSGLDGGERQVDLQVLLLQLVQRPVGLQRA